MFERLSRKRQEEGFTLIELLIVIVILGILAAVVVFAVGGISDRGKKAACQSDLKTVETAVEAYYAQNSKYPAGGPSDPPTEAERYKTLTDAKLLKSAPTATLADNGYVINLGANGAVSANPANCAGL
ncbi:MAG TPA: prepilin-type N-terminal cleavage/methylation domain-containing protein [Acidimicrobiales bacterium]|nr:prepilin-type N-terminal cleavage/methylation domain-containing protein [Acidimicrobiales bacterium]